MATLIKYEQAKDHYKAHPLDFKEELRWHNVNGWVINVPYVFGMGFFYDDEDGHICRISYANGNIRALIGFCLNIEIDFFEFERNCNGRFKRYDVERFKRLV